MKFLTGLAKAISDWWLSLDKVQMSFVAVVCAISLSAVFSFIHKTLNGNLSEALADWVMFALCTSVLLLFSWLLTKNLRGKQELEQTQAELRDMAIRDALTGLYNRRALIDELTRLRSYVQRELRRKENVSLVLIFMDLNHLKFVNDTYGHQAGDSAICTVAAILSDEIREGEDFLGRYGGDEYCAAITFDDYESERALLKQMAALTFRIKKRIRSAPFFVGSKRVPLSITIGAHIVNVRNPDVLAELAKADNKLLQKKERRKIGRYA